MLAHEIDDAIALRVVELCGLTIRTEPSAATAVIIEPNGRRWERETPFEGVEIPVGVYEIRLKSMVYDEKVLKNVKVEEGQSTKIIERLEINN